MKKIVTIIFTIILLTSCNFEPIPTTATGPDYGIVSSITLYLVLIFALISILRTRKIRD